MMHLQFTLQFVDVDFRRAAHQRDSFEPRRQRQMRILENGSSPDRELRATSQTLIEVSWLATFSVRENSRDSVSEAPGTLHARRPAQPFQVA